MNLTDIISQRPDLVSADMDGDTVMMDVQSGKYFKFAGTSQTIWQLIEQPVPISYVIDQLTSEYDISRTDCEREVLLFLNDLQKRNLIIVQK